MWGIILALAVGSAQAAVTDVTLDNGLRVIVQEDHRAPVMVSQVWYRAGSMDEFNGTTGVAHVLEHMMFRGTKDVPSGEFSKKIAAAGARMRLPATTTLRISSKCRKTGWNCRCSWKPTAWRIW
jgi:zinc protease